MPEVMMSGRKILLVFLFIYTLGSGIIASLAPYRGFPDEAGHLAYVRYIRLHHELPKLSYERSEIPITLAFHPPLYYLCAATLFQPGWSLEIQVTILRLFSLLQGMLTVFILWKCANLIFPGNPAAVMLTMAVTVFNPQFVFIHSGIGNIPMTSLTCALAAFYLIKIMVAPENLRRDSLLLGIAVGLAILSRTVAVYLAPIALLALFLKTKNTRKFLQYAAFFSFCAALTGGWWYIRNWIQYGDPLMWKVFSVALVAPWMQKASLFQWNYFLERIPFLYASFWAYFGRNEYHAGIWEYALYLFLDLLALLGIARVLFKSKEDSGFQLPVFERAAFSLLVVAGLLALMEIVFAMMKIVSPAGRYLYMAIVPLSIARSAGLLKILPPGFRTRGAILYSAFLCVFGAYLLLRYWLPHV